MVIMTIRGPPLLVSLLFGIVMAADTHFTSPEVLPSPETQGVGWTDAYNKADNLVSKLTIEQKVSLVTGYYGASGCNGNIAPIPSLGFGGLCLQDGPVGIRLADLASTFPAGLTAAATWDKDLIYDRGKAIGSEFRGKGANVILGPVGGPLGRHLLGGRNWEGFSPDPYLTGVAMASSIKGIQDAGIQATAKHFIGNEQETMRGGSLTANGTLVDAISSNIDDRTMHELYLWPFADAVKSGVSSVMCSYNRVNQTYSCENSKILNGLLKGELGFQGYVVSDWSATHSGVKAITSGLDMNMPGPISDADPTSNNTYFGQNITLAVNNGSLPEDRLDDMARRVLTPYFFLGQDATDFPTVDPSTIYVLLQTYGYSATSLGLPPAPASRDVRQDHKKLIREMGAAGVVLLKNTNGTLPLRSQTNIGVFGNSAGDVTDGLYYEGTKASGTGFGFQQGTLSVGGGSGTGRSTYIISPLQTLLERSDARVQYILDNEFIASGDLSSIYPTPDACLVFLKTWASEGYDRTSFENDWDSTVVVNNITAKCPNTVVITHSGGVNTMPWASNPNVTAILAAHYPGQESGNSIVDVLYGDVNPSGRLPYTIPAKESDYDIPVVNVTGPEALDSSAWQSDFAEGLFIDYRHFDAKNITPLFEFGFGLSYTTYGINEPPSVKSVNNISSPFPLPSTTVAPGGNPDLYTELFNVKANVSNTGAVPGAAVLQLYVSLKDAAVPEGTPVRVLRGFEKVHIEPGDSAAVEFQLTRRDLSFWNTTAQDWQIPAGDALLSLGFSSRDLRSSSKVRLL
ncbi:related to beta-glucosidase 1 precursor [Phialocephala subalpina]|uniref:Probable beta-glucosidase G n=1 Tax=Phialocephala subalpina TaxID=576137 RepID=A0A1L7WBM1_9HELO|nr:related to beta-glucosidase 1 precursor [Phialocephala subalpina]